MSDLKRRETNLKEALSRTDREKTRLQQRLASLSELPAAAATAIESQNRQHKRDQRLASTSSFNSSSTFTSTESFAPPIDRTPVVIDPDSPESETRLYKRLQSFMDENDSLQRRIYELEVELSDWKRLAEVDRANEIESLKFECSKLRDRLDDIVHDDYRKNDSSDENYDNEYKNDSSHDFNKFDTSARRGERSKGHRSVLEARIKNLMERVEKVEAEKLKVEATLLEMRYDKENAVSAAERLGRRASELEEVIYIAESVTNFITYVYFI